MDENTNAFPEDLTALDTEGLTAAEQAARTESADLRKIKPEDMTDTQVDRLEAIADFLDNVAAEGTRRETAAAERAARIQNANDRIEPVAETDTEGETPDEAPVDEPPAEETPDEAPAPDEAPDEAADLEGDTAEVEAPTAIAASAARRPASTVKRMRQPSNPTPKQEAPVSNVMSIVAAADIALEGGGHVSSGADLGAIGGAAEAFIGRLGRFPQIAQKGGYDRQRVALIQREQAGFDGLHVNDPQFGGDRYAALKAASKESRLEGGSLVAAGGWCAPSTNLYGMCADETLDGILDLPTIGVDRGGINYTPGPDFQDIYTDAGFFQTEAQAIAGETKNCTEVDCPDFTEIRLDAVGICVKSPLLTKSAYPELVARFLEGTVIANQHKINGRIITAMRTALGTAWAPTLTDTPVAWSALTAVEWVIETQKQAYRLSDGESLEVIAPRWLRVQIRADFANRQGSTADIRVTNAMLNDHFADRGAAIQWVLGYQEIASPTGTSFITIPATVELMVYKAGTFVKGTADVIALDAVYDAADLVTNVFTAAFVEDGVLLAKMCHGGKRITVPTGASGETGAADLNDPWGQAQVA